MTKAIFTARISPSYKDVLERWYHFPKMYLNQVRQSVGDFIIYYEPGRTGVGGGRAGRLSYFAVARVSGIREDPELQDHFYADIDSFLNFDSPVPFRTGSQFFESALVGNKSGVNSGVFQRSVRAIPDHEFQAIVDSGFSDLGHDDPVNRRMSGFEEAPETFKRPIIEQVISRPFREAKFSAQVRQAYHSTCALTGLCIINGGGRPEVDAAHIQPVGEGHNGPDSVRNGLALSKTVHWMFDRGLVSVTDDYRILAAEKQIPEPALKLLNADGRLILPDNPVEQPHPAFLQYHRDQIYKG